MIHSIQIKNFQSHKKTKLEFSKGVNVIVGATDSGKSSIIKALRWAVTNKPSGDSFRSSWGGDTEVIVEVDNHSISRLKSDVNTYGLDEKIFKAFGADVPSEIKKVLNLNGANLQTQFESHFLLSKSAGEVATHFNKVAHLDKIDVGLQNIQRWLKKLQQGIVYNESQIEDLSEQLKEYDSLENIEKIIVRGEKIEESLKINEKQFNQLNHIEDLLFDVNKDTEKLEEITSKEVLVDKVLVTVERQNAAVMQLRSLEMAWVDISKTIKEMEVLENIIPAENLISRVFAIEKDIKEIGIQIFGNLVNEIIEMNKKRERKKEFLKNMELKFHEEMDVCPLCETVLK